MLHVTHTGSQGARCRFIVNQGDTLQEWVNDLSDRQPEYQLLTPTVSLAFKDQDAMRIAYDAIVEALRSNATDVNVYYYPTR